MSDHKSMTGRYNGVSWARIRFCDMMYTSNSKSFAYWPIDNASGEYTGDNFRTLTAMKRFICDNPELFKAEVITMSDTICAVCGQPMRHDDSITVGAYSYDPSCLWSVMDEIEVEIDPYYHVTTTVYTVEIGEVIYWDLSEDFEIGHDPCDNIEDVKAAAVIEFHDTLDPTPEHQWEVTEGTSFAETLEHARKQREELRR